MQRDCSLCGGQCGAVFERAVVDSWDHAQAHWIGAGRLPEADKNRLLKAMLNKQLQD
jgi:hypothetical protein